MEKPSGKTKKIVIVSDGTGKTAKRLLDSVLSQYAQKNVRFSLVDIYHDIREQRTFDRIVQQIDSEYLVIYSIISEDFANYIRGQLEERGIMGINVLEPMLGIMSKFLGINPDHKPGVLQIIDDNYYKKIDAIGYTVEHDDGRGQYLPDADLVLLGLSRTCKTPISMYLACNFGVKVANIPIIIDPVLHERLLERLTPVKHDRIVGILMQPEILARVREERLNFLARPDQSQAQLRDYCDLWEIREELTYCRRFYTRHGWQTIDVTRRAIEEISLDLLSMIGFAD